MVTRVTAKSHFAIPGYRQVMQYFEAGYHILSVTWHGKMKICYNHTLPGQVTANRKEVKNGEKCNFLLHITLQVTRQTRVTA